MYDSFERGVRRSDDFPFRIHNHRVASVRGSSDTVDGGDIDLVFDGAGLEECFPVGASFGGPGCLDRDEVCALLGRFAEYFGSS